jgi:hypothetical protein
MRASFITAGLMTALVLVAAPLPRQTASAADLGEDYAEPPYAEGGDDGAYDDGAYANAPAYDERSRHSYSETHEYEQSYDAAEPPRGSVKDGYPVPVPPPRYGDRRPDRVEHFATCLDTWQIRRRLRGEGWSGIRPMGGDGGIVHIQARRFDSSSIFHLRVDRCSGAVIAARPERLRSFALRERPWRGGY